MPSTGSLGRENAMFQSAPLFFFSFTERKRERSKLHIRAVTMRGGHVEVREKREGGNAVEAGNYSSRIIKTNRVGF